MARVLGRDNQIDEGGGRQRRGGRRWSNPNWGEAASQVGQRFRDIRRPAVQEDRGELPEGEGQAPSMSRIGPGIGGVASQLAAAQGLNLRRTDGDGTLEGPGVPGPAPRRQRGTNMDPGNVMGSSGRQERTVNGRTYLMDGSWMVDKEALAPYGYDPDAAPPEVVEANRVERAQLRNMARREQVAAHNDANWGAEAQAAGYGDWRESRRAVMKAFQADPVKFWQMAGNGGGGDMTLQPTPDDLERFSHWLWITNPANQAEVMTAYKGGAQPPVDPTARQNPANQPPPPVMPPAPTGGATQVINGVTYTQRPDGTWVAGGPAATPPQTPPQPATDPFQGATSRPMQTTRPPQPAQMGGMSDTIKPPQTGPMPPPQMGAMQKNPMQTSVSSYIGAPKPGSFGNSSQFKLPSIKPSAGIVKPQGTGMLPKMPGTSGKIGSF